MPVRNSIDENGQGLVVIDVRASYSERGIRPRHLDAKPATYEAFSSKWPD